MYGFVKYIHLIKYSDKWVLCRRTKAIIKPEYIALGGDEMGDSAPHRNAKWRANIINFYLKKQTCNKHLIVVGFGWYSH